MDDVEIQPDLPHLRHVRDEALAAADAARAFVERADALARSARAGLERAEEAVHAAQGALRVAESRLEGSSPPRPAARRDTEEPTSEDSAIEDVTWGA